MSDTVPFMNYGCKETDRLRQKSEKARTVKDFTNIIKSKTKNESVFSSLKQMSHNEIVRNSGSKYQTITHCMAKC